MHNKKSKEEFIADVEVEIGIRRNMLTWLEEHFYPIVKKFDGKVYNKRLITALEETLDEDWCLTRTDYTSVDVEGVENAIENHIEFFCWRPGGNKIVMYIGVVTGPDGRIKGDAHTTRTDNNIKSFSNSVSELRAAIERYDEVAAQAQLIEDVINEFAEMPYAARRNFTGFRKWYLE